MGNISRVYEIEKNSHDSRLEKEVGYRKFIEKQLRNENKILSSMLDTVSEALIAFNEFSDIVLVNKSFEKISGYEKYELSGLSVNSLIKINDNKKFQQFFRESTSGAFKDPLTLNLKKIAVSMRSGEKIIVNVNIVSVEIERQRIFLIKLLNSKDLKVNVNFELPMKITEVIHYNQKKILCLKKNIENIKDIKINPDIVKTLENLIISLEVINKSFFNDNIKEKQRILAVKLMNTALQYWMKSTGKSKSDLAVHSKIWKMYITNDGFQRTQTLDKYFNIRTLPKLPRWQKITSTAEFVLNFSVEDNVERRKLEELFLEFQLVI